MYCSRRARGGFTLVELLVVITIIGILIALLLPAVQAAREAARMTQCQNNLKQLALGCLAHENATGRYPTDGWGPVWTGDADLGNDCRQPGGWIYNVLPYIEQQALHQMGAGLPQAQKYAAHLQRAAVPLAFLYCPTRRPPVTFPTYFLTHNGYLNAGTPLKLGHTDYASNFGDLWICDSYGSYFQASWAEFSASYGGSSGPASVSEVIDSHGAITSNARTTFRNIARFATGIAYIGSMIKPVDIADGLSNTYLAGEKFVNPEFYLSDGLYVSSSGTVAYDDYSGALSGFSRGIARGWANLGPNIALPRPLPDLEQVDVEPKNRDLKLFFGSAHLSAFNMAFCDGSVHPTSYLIDTETHRRLCNRKDGLPVDAKKF
jgi:prepilin-type N-terminal cleavage/methylation domain-containing protein/prepilin-type processing-associated H-X9-DG protein